MKETVDWIWYGA